MVCVSVPMEGVAFVWKEKSRAEVGQSENKIKNYCRSYRSKGNLSCATGNIVNDKNSTEKGG